jgi:hypothetical protein
MVEITTYDSVEEMMDDLGKAMDAADARVTEQQKKYRPGDVVMSDSGYGFPIFHDIQDIEKMVGEGFKKYGDDYEEEGIYLLDLYREPHMRFYCFSKSYSECCPEGELGDFHISQGLYRIPREVFDDLKERGFRLQGDET